MSSRHRFASARAIAALPDWAAALVDLARQGKEDVPTAVALARDYGSRLPLPGVGSAERWSVLAAVGAANLTSARVLEAHSDAHAILSEAKQPPEPGTAWGVFAAEAPDVRLDAETSADGTTRLAGVKPWCSVAADLDAALVTAHTPDGRRLFRVDLHHPSVTPEPADRWVARGLRTITSAPVRFDRTPASPVGEPGWYLHRSGFAWGGLGVAACWYGGAVGVAGAVEQRAASKRGDLDWLHLGAVDVALHGARAALVEAAALVDGGEAAHGAGELLALRVRSVVADAVERVLLHAAHALGPAALAFDADHAARVADLELYVRQHHAERDLAALGRALTEPAR